MTNKLKKVGKKAFSMSVTVMTIAWSIGVAALVPAGVSAATCPTLAAGDLFKVADNTAVYLLNSDMERMYFPNGEVYKTWYADYSGINVIPNTCVDAYPAPTAAPYGVNYRPGSRLVKVQISPSVYVVEPGNTKSKIASAAIASELYGADWATKVRDVADVFWPNYANSGSEITESALHNGMLVKKTGETTVYQMVDGMLYMVDGAMSGATSGDVQEVSATVFDAAAMATTNVTPSSVVEDPTQGATTGGSGTVVTGGDLTVSLSADTPVSASVIINTDNVVFTKVMVSAGSDADAIINAVKVGRSGLGATGDFTNVTLYDGSTKLGSTKTTWDSSGEFMTYNVSGGWTIPAGTSKELTIVAKIDTAGTFNALGVVDMTLGSGTVSGVPVYGNAMSGVNVSVGTVTITNSASAVTKKIGTTGVIVSKFKLAIGSVEDSEFQSITLKNKAASSNAADGDLKNFYLYQGTTVLAGPVSMVSDKITFVLDTPYSILKNKNETFTVKADVVNGDGNTAEFVLDTTSDLKVVGSTYNTRLTVTSTNFNAATEGAIITIDGAELNISFTSTLKDVADDRTDVEFGTLTLSAGSTDMKITTMIFGIFEADGDGDATNNKDVDNFEIVSVGGAAYSGVMSGGGDGDVDGEVWTFSDEVYLNAGETLEFSVRGDLPTGIGSGDTYKVTSTINTTNWVAETVPAGDAVSNFSVGSITGKTVTVKGATLTIKASPMNTGTAVINDTAVEIFNGTLEATSGEVRISQLKFEGGNSAASNTSTVEDNLDKANWSDLALYVDGVFQQNVTNSGLTTGYVDFDTIDVLVVPGTSRTFSVKGTVSSALDASNRTVHAQLSVITAKDADNDDATVQDSSGTAISTTDQLETTRTLTLKEKGNLYVQLRNNDAGINKDRVVVAGTDLWAGKLRLRAEYEDVLLKDLKLTNSNSGTEDEVESVCLYKEKSNVSANLVGCTTVDTSDIAFFNGVNEVIPQGTHDWWIYVNTNEMGNGATQTSDSQNAAGEAIQYKIVTTTGHLTAEGVDSGEAFTYGNLDSTAGTSDGVAAGEIVFDLDLDGFYDEAADDGGTAETKDYYVAGTKITKVEFVTAMDGESVATGITGTGVTTLAILAVTVSDSNNTDTDGNSLKLAVDSLLFDISKFNGVAVTTGTIERINGVTGAVTFTVATASSTGSGASDVGGDWTLSAATTTLGNDALIDQGATAYFVVKANITALSTTTNETNWIQVGLDDLKGSDGDANNNIDWFDGYDTTYTIANNYDFLYLDTESIDGTRISAPKNS
ncbi:MAG: hypothetical protein L3J07_00555 [Candidatus Magasanikbacteria bacterium]|nr:hypothetical protein [Candidatus Magasanikbacteria bacterium]